MKRFKLSILPILLLINLIDLSAQIWPFSPIIRFGNTVYYEIDSLSREKIAETNVAFDNELNNRFFDLICKNDSIGLIINNSKIYVKQKQRKIPRCYEVFPLYHHRTLVNSQMKIRYLKLIELNNDSIIAQVTIKQKKSEGKKRVKDNIEVSREDLSGVFLGNGQFTRGFGVGTAYGISLGYLIFFIL